MLDEMGLIYRAFVMAIFCIIIAGCSFAQPSRLSISTKLDAMLSKFYKASEPGASVVVIKDGQTIFRKSYGMANIESNVPIADNMVFRIGSLTKQFTAASVMKLVEQKKIKLSDPLGMYLPQFPTYGHTITIENLLTHTSGIGGFENLEQLMVETSGKGIKVDQIISHFENQLREFDPSAEYEYSNPGYILLGAIVEKVSGITYQSFVETEIFEPLEMRNSYFIDAVRIIPGRVSGYHRTEDGFTKAKKFNTTIPYSAGGLQSSLEDILIWNNALHSGEIVSKASYQKMITPFTLLNGKTIEYGYGLEILKANNGNLIAHQGGIFGFQSFVGIWPNENLQIIILTNTDNPLVLPNEVADKIIDIVAR